MSAASKSDDRISGSKPLRDRPEGAKLLAVLRPGDAVITPKLDRMFRSALDAIEVLEDMKAKGVSLHMIDLGGDVTGNGVSKLVFTILSAVAEAERDRIKERIRDVKRDHAAQGLYNGGRRRFGFDIVEGKLIPNKAEQATIAKMRRLKAKGVSLRDIADECGLKMGAETVRRILSRQ